MVGSGEPVAAAPAVGPPTVAPSAPAGAGMGSVFDLIVESLFGDASAQPSAWRPLPFGTFFSEGWNQAYNVGARTGFFTSLGVGQYFPCEDHEYFRSFYSYTVANVNTTTDNRGPNQTFLGFTPGIRFALSKFWHFLAAVEVTVAGPKAFDYQPIFLILKDY